MKMTGDELRKGLLDLGLPEDDINAFVQRQNEAESDDSIDLEGVQAVAEELAKSMGAQPTFDEPDYDDEPASDGEFVDVSFALEQFAKAADGMVDRQNAYIEHAQDQTEVLQKAWLAGMKVQEELVKANQELTALVKSQGKQLGAIMEQLGTPVPPRSVSGDYEAVPAPGERQATETEVMAKGGDVRDQIIAGAHAEMRKDGTPKARRLELHEAVSAIETGHDPSQIAKSYNIAIAG